MHTCDGSVVTTAFAVVPAVVRILKTAVAVVLLLELISGETGCVLLYSLLVRLFAVTMGTGQML